MSSITATPLAPTFGLEISGLDLSKELTSKEIEFIRKAWLDASGLLLFRDQQISPDDHVRLTSYFGRPDRDGAKDSPVLAHYFLQGHPEIYRVSNKKVDGKPLGREDAGTYWHADGSWMTNQPRGSILHALELPRVGGDTMFADLAGAYDALSPPIQSLLSDLTAIHTVLKAALGTSYAKEYAGKLEQAAQKSSVKPVILKHPINGRPAIGVNPGFTQKILELSDLESDAILTMLFEHCTKPEFVYRHRWQLHDVAMWDNYSNMHYAVANYKAHGYRLLNRTTVLLD